MKAYHESWLRTSVSALALLSLLPGVESKFLATTDSPDGTLHIGFKSKRASTHPNPRSYDNIIQKRDNEYLQVPLDNLFSYYNVEVELGTPAQTFNLLIDTGSSDLWVISDTNPYCATTNSQLSDPDYIDCSTSGVFAYSDSSTFIANNSDFFIQYGDGTVAEGDWAMDTLVIQGQTVTNMSFGLGTTTNSSVGILGIGYATNEATLSINPPYMYANLPIRLTQEGVINIPAYSLWLNDITADEGNILFGGVDHDKYTGDLITVPILKSSSTASQPTAFLIAFSGLEYTSDGSSDQLLGSTIEALLDSGTSLSYFPQSVAANILNAFNGSYSSQLGYYIQSCNLEGSLDYDFSGAKISVPFSSLLLPVTSSRGPARFNNGDPVCAIGIMASNYPFALLGDTFLRSAYVVYDMQNHEIALAQAAINVTDSDIEVISSSIPGASRASRYSSTTGITLQSANAGNIGGLRTMVSTATASDGSVATITYTTGSSTATSTSDSSGSAPALEYPSFSLLTFMFIFIFSTIVVLF